MVTTTQSGQKIEDIDWKKEGLKTDMIKQKDQIVSRTPLSGREADVHLVYENHPDVKTLQDVAEVLELNSNTVYTYNRKIKDKVSKAEATVELL